MSVSCLPDVLCSGDLRFDAKHRTLIVTGKRVQLDSRSALVFQTLAEHFGEFVSKDTLLATAWPGRLVHENSLAKAISRLRGALGGSSLEITASYGFGYSLRQTCLPHVDEEGGEGSIKAPSTSWQLKLADKNWKILATISLVVTATTAIFAMNRSFSEVAIRTTEPKTNDPADARATILWVDDNPSNNLLEVQYFNERKIAVHLAESTDEALKLLRMNSYELVLSDLGRAEDRLAGLDLTNLIRREGRKLPVIIYTMRPKSREGQMAQKQMVAEAGATDLALTPAEVRSKVVGLVDKGTKSPSP